MHKTTVSEFFTTVSKKQTLNSLASLTYKIGSLRSGKDTEKLTGELEEYFGGDAKVYLFYSARIALYQYLVQNKDTDNPGIILSGYNCVSVSNACIQAGYTPIYADIETDTLGIDVETLETHISTNTKFIIIQHSFGLPARDTEKIISWARKNNIKIIEDVAHSLGAELEGKKLGTFGDAAFFSTGRDKVISSVNGGILLIHDKKSSFKNTSILPTRLLTVKNHIYNILGFLAYFTYDFLKIGKIIMAVSKKMSLFPTIVSHDEKLSGEKKLNYTLPNSLAFLGSKEFVKLEPYIKIRKKYQQYYLENLDKRFTILDTENIGNAFRICLVCDTGKQKDDIYAYMKKKGILLGISWSDINIAPHGTNLEKAYYKIGSCPVAEKIASRLLFLPASYTHTINQIENTCKILNTYGK